MSLIRNVIKADLSYLKTVIDSSGLFPSEMLDGMMADYFQNPSSPELWVTREEQGTPVAVAYCAPERLTDGTFNLYLIAIRNDYQGMGFGSELLRHIENVLRNNGQRILIVETSGLPEYQRTREFYTKANYVHEATIRDFYKEGEDKIVFWKKL